MTPDSIESRYAGLRAEVTALEGQIRVFGGLVAGHERLDERISNLRRDLDSFRAEVNDRVHTVHDAQAAELRREVEKLHTRIDRIVDRRDIEMKELAKRREDGDLALEAKIERRYRDVMAEIEAGQTVALGKRGQNVTLIVGVIAAIAALVTTLLTIIGG